MENLTRKYATIQNESENFVTCLGVKERMPFGKKQKFSKGSVWAWARIKAPRTEKIRFEWYENGQHVHTSNASVVASSGYRLFYARNYPTDKTKGEIRIYNSQNSLIGRKEFQIGNVEYTTDN